MDFVAFCRFFVQVYSRRNEKFVSKISAHGFIYDPLVFLVAMVANTRQRAATDRYRYTGMKRAIIC
jgi:hypothetical protein